jgi:hypothetical protein
MIRCAECSYIIDEEMCVCPKCHTELKSVRVAQYGGVGGQPANWSPGTSPNARGSHGGSASWEIDAGLDAIMGRTRHDVDTDYMGDSNLETRLAKFHSYIEDDIKPYLPYKERQKIKENENLQRKEKFEKDTANALFTNSPQYIKQYFSPKLEHMLTVEEQLAKIRDGDGDRTKAADDKVTVIDPATGQEKVASVKFAKIRHTTNTVFDSGSESSGEFKENEYPSDDQRLVDPDYAQFHYFPMGNTGGDENKKNGGPLAPGFSQVEVDNFLSNDDVYPYLEETTEAYDYPQADEVDMMGERAYDKTPSVLTKDKNGSNVNIKDNDVTIEDNDTVFIIDANGKQKYNSKDTIRNNPNTTIEKQLSGLKNQKSPDALPGDPSETFNMDKIRGQEGLGTKYPWYQHTTPVPGI